MNEQYWTPEEIEILKTEYPQNGCNIPALAHKTKYAIRSKARKYNLHTNLRWNKEDDDILIQEYPIKGADIPALAWRGKRAITKRARS